MEQSTELFSENKQTPGFTLILINKIIKQINDE